MLSGIRKLRRESATTAITVFDFYVISRNAYRSVQGKSLLGKVGEIKVLRQLRAGVYRLLFRAHRRALLFYPFCEINTRKDSL